MKFCKNYLILVRYCKHLKNFDTIEIKIHKLIQKDVKIDMHEIAEVLKKEIIHVQIGVSLQK